MKRIDRSVLSKAEKPGFRTILLECSPKIFITPKRGKFESWETLMVSESDFYRCASTSLPRFLFVSAQRQVLYKQIGPDSNEVVRYLDESYK